jgi:hypothetical protein
MQLRMVVPWRRSQMRCYFRQMNQTRPSHHGRDGDIVHVLSEQKKTALIQVTDAVAFSIHPNDGQGMVA